MNGDAHAAAKVADYLPRYLLEAWRGSGAVVHVVTERGDLVEVGHLAAATDPACSLTMRWTGPGGRVELVAEVALRVERAEVGAPLALFRGHGAQVGEGVVTSVWVTRAA